MAKISQQYELPIRTWQIYRDHEQDQLKVTGAEPNGILNGTVFGDEMEEMGEKLQ
jgi:hypothetical protein